jgi:alkylation response protein AidB-like acyl-CoA dehydrogenase
MQDVQLTPEQQMLQQSARRYLSEAYGFRKRQEIVASAAGVDEGSWQDFATLGWLGLPFPEAYGGSGGSALDLLLLCAEFGRALVVEPYLSCVALAGMAVLLAGSEEQKRKVLPSLIAGDLQLALALGEPQSGSRLDVLATTAHPTAHGWKLCGHKAVVLGAPSADLLVVSARPQGDAGAQADPSLFLVGRALPGVRLRSYETIDGRRAAEVLLEDVQVCDADRLAGEAVSVDVLQRIAHWADLALLAECMGCVDAAFEETIAYLETREQFGQKLASFQALRHRVADMFVLKEEIKALGLLAGRTLSLDGPAAAQALAGARAYAGREGRRLCEEAVQLHGAIAITDEYVVGHYLKRVVALERLFGDADVQLTRYLAARGQFQES